VPADVFLGLGSNVGSRESHLEHAIRRLAAEMELVALSSVYETDPVGFTEQGPFLNMVVRFRADREPAEVLSLGRQIEAERGRARTVPNGPRTLDIDLLLYGDRVVSAEGLTVPHPRMLARPFVLVPLLEIAPELADPVTGKPYRDALNGLAGDGRTARPDAGAGPGARRVMDWRELHHGREGAAE